MWPGKGRPANLVLLSLALLWPTPSQATPGQYNYTTDENRIVCAYPLSGQYCLLSRVLFYSLLVFSVFARRQVWLIAGALASALTYGGTAAVHAFLLSVSNSGDDALYDLDIVGIWAVLTAGLLAVELAVEWSNTLRESQFRTIFALWSVLAWVGIVCSFATLTHSYPSEPLCPADGAAGSGLMMNSTCRYSCRDHRQLFRSQDDIIIMSAKQAFGDHAYLLSTVVYLMLPVSGLTVYFSMMSACTRKRTNAELRRSIQSNSPSRPGAYTAKMRRMRRLARDSARKELRTGKVQVSRSCFAYINIVLFPAVVFINEAYILLGAEVPTDEKPYAIGQWGPFVGVFLALCASAINHSSEPTWKLRQEVLALERIEFERLQAEGKDLSETEELIQPHRGAKPGADRVPKGKALEDLEQQAQERLEKYDLDFATSTWRLKESGQSSLDLESGPLAEDSSSPGEDHDYFTT